MAEVKLFEIDFGDSVETIQALRNELKQTKVEFENAKVGSEAFVKAQKGVSDLNARIKQLNDTTKAQVNALGGVNKSAQFADGSYGKLKQSIKAAQENLLKLNVESKEFEDEQENLIKLQNQRIEIEKKIPSLFQERIKGAINEANSLKDLRAQLKAFQSQALQGDKEAAAKAAELKDRLEDLRDATAFTGSGVEKLGQGFNFLKEGIANFDSDKIETAFQGIGGAMKAIPIFVLIEGIKLLIDNFEAVTKFVHSFSDEAKNVKKLELAFEALNFQTNQNRNSLEKSIAIQQANIELSKAQNKSNVEIQKQEAELFDTKVKLIKVDLQQAKASLLLNDSKLKDIQSNNSLIESYYDLTASVLRYAGNEKDADEIDKLTALNKKERSKDVKDALQEDINKISQLTTDLATLQITNETRITQNAKEQATIRREANEELTQLQIDNIKNTYEQAIAQSKLDEKLEIEAIKRRRLGAETTANLIEEVQKKGAAARIELDIEEENKRLAVRKSLAEKEIESERGNNEKVFEAKMKALEIQREIELSDLKLTNDQKAVIDADFRNQQRQLQKDYEDQIRQDLIAANEIIISQNKFNVEAQFDARKEVLEIQKQQELSDLDLSEQERLAIIQKYNDLEIQLTKDKAQAKADIRNKEIEFDKNAANTLIGIGQLLTKDKEQQNEIAKVQALVQLAANTAIAISEGVAASAGVPFPGNLFAIATTVAAVVGNLVAAKNAIQGFAEGGVITGTLVGDHHGKPIQRSNGDNRLVTVKTGEVVLNRSQQAALGGPKTFAKIGVPGFATGGIIPSFDGGFASRSATSRAEDNLTTSRLIKQMAALIPAPVLKISELDKVQSSTERAIVVSGL